MNITMIFVSKNDIECSSFMTLCLGSIAMEHVISKPCYKGTILQWNCRKMATFSYNSFVKFQGNNFWEATFYPCYVIMRCVIKGLHYIMEC